MMGDGHKGSIRFKCDCGHKMRTKLANFLNDLKPVTYWRCSKCRLRFRIMINIEAL